MFSPAPSFTKKEDDKSKIPTGFAKKKEDPLTPPPDSPLDPSFHNFSSFNSSKTFGGDRSKMAMFPLKPPGNTTSNPILGSM